MHEISFANRRWPDRMTSLPAAKLPMLTIAKQSGPPPNHLKAIDFRKGLLAVERGGADQHI
jgi:hypothetical protein